MKVNDNFIDCGLPRGRGLYQIDNHSGNFGGSPGHQPVIVLTALVGAIFNSQCQGWWENVGNEIFYIWVVCIPFGPPIRVTKICQAVSISGKALGLQAVMYT